MKNVRRAVLTIAICTLALFGVATTGAAAQTVDPASASMAQQASVPQSDPLTITNRLPYAVDLWLPTNLHIEAGQSVTVRTGLVSQSGIYIVRSDSKSLLLNADTFVYQGRWHSITVLVNKVSYQVTLGSEPVLVLS